MQISEARALSIVQFEPGVLPVVGVAAPHSQASSISSSLCDLAQQ